MKYEELERYEKFFMKEVVERRSRGGYSPDAPFLEIVATFCYELARHFKERAPQPKPKKKDHDPTAD